MCILLIVSNLLLSEDMMCMDLISIFWKNEGKTKKTNRRSTL